MSLKSVLDTAVATSLRIRLEPYLVEGICELSRALRDRGMQHSDLSGLLFGRQDTGFRTAEALKTFADVGTHSELARRERWERAYKATLDESKQDHELSTLDIVGWFSFRSASGLSSSDVAFHNQHFRKPDDLALIVWSDDPSQITTEVYSRSESDVLTVEDCRWGSVRLSADMRHVREPVEISMRLKVSGDSFLRTYDTPEFTQLGSSKRKAGRATGGLFSFLNRHKGEPEQEVNGYSGNGHSRPGKSNRPLNSQAYVNPFLAEQQSPSRRALPGEYLGDFDPRVAQSEPSTVVLPPAAARSFDPAPDPRFQEPVYLPTAATAASTVPYDFSAVGRAPRSGRSPQTEVSGLPVLLRQQSPRTRSFPWAWAALVFVLCSGIMFALLALGGLGQGGRLGQAFQALFPGTELNLRVHNEDDRLRLSWNQRNHVVAAANDATLQIFDGSQHRDVHLDGRQVADGSVLYRPLTNDVTFRLEVRGEQGAVSGSVRILDSLSGEPQATLDVSSPPGTPSGGQTALSEPGASSPAPDEVAPSPDNRAQGSSAPTIVRDQAGTLLPSAQPGGFPATAAPGSGSSPPPNTSRFESPGSPGASGSPSRGSTINGWDISSTRTRSRQNAAPPVFSTANSTSSGYVPPTPVLQIMPDTSEIPNGTIQSRTRVEVQVDVDRAGRVSNAHVVTGSVNEKISSAALTAARQWTFSPATANGQHVDSEHIIVFEFSPERR